jgi:(p)ppGpp synthase/HD superfamily hydrolase
MAAAVLHDVPEDHPELFPLSLIFTEFGVNIHRIVDGVTRRAGETYANFILRANLDPGSRLLKIIDVLTNLGRIDSLPIEEQSIRRRYERALLVLNAAEFDLQGSKP